MKKQLLIILAVCLLCHSAWSARQLFAMIPKTNYDAIPKAEKEAEDRELKKETTAPNPIGFVWNHTNKVSGVWGVTSYNSQQANDKMAVEIKTYIGKYGGYVEWVTDNGAALLKKHKVTKIPASGVLQ